MAAHILIIEDDLELIASIRSHLEPLGFRLTAESDGEKGIARALDEHFELIISDINLPTRNGFDVCREVRYHHNNVPILILSAHNDVFDRVVGLEIGADDYLVKPFHLRELTARIEALLRRANRAAEENRKQSGKIVFQDLEIDRERMQVTRGGELIALSATEYRVLETLAQSPGKVFSREELRDQVWGYAASSFEHTVTTTLHRLRAKLEPDPAEPRYIFSVRGVGYKFAEAVDAANTEKKK